MTNTETFAGIAPRHPPTQFAYETECKQALEPVLLQLLDKAEAAEWDRARRPMR